MIMAQDAVAIGMHNPHRANLNFTIGAPSSHENNSAMHTGVHKGSGRCTCRCGQESRAHQDAPRARRTAAPLPC